TGEHILARQLCADHSSGAHHDIPRVRPQFPGNTLGGGPGVLVAAGTRVAIGATAGIEDHGASAARFQYPLTPHHWVRPATVTGEHRRGDVLGAVVDHQCDVRLTTRLETRR